MRRLTQKAYSSLNPTQDVLFVNGTVLSKGSKPSGDQASCVSETEKFPGMWDFQC